MSAVTFTTTHCATCVPGTLSSITINENNEDNYEDDDYDPNRFAQCTLPCIDVGDDDIFTMLVLPCKPY